MWREWLHALERMGRNVEAVPGWHYVERTLDAGFDGLAFGIALAWAMRWIWALLTVAILVASSTH